MGGGQIDSAPVIANPNVNALIWGGYSGQEGGAALFDVITGKTAPAGRLPLTQYPANYVSQIPMTDMSLRPSSNLPGRTYKWYTGKPTFEFVIGLHYTRFLVNMAEPYPSTIYDIDIAGLVSKCNEAHQDRCHFHSFFVAVENIRKLTSDYVALDFITGSFGPKPYPKSLVNYQRLHSIKHGEISTAVLNLTLGSLARIDN
ncbi:hypothetical protein BP6252_08193 [Coleophoma cylindrospora]|uniref:Glycoside hydrolase family 3 C-terminal domain-containing protein n=1 Tax=Coleophoma cylindrospora TaxID=1849047 RepID=A0A3D8RCC7_9HELO|nr:hypothetical protein BP6252_08193 [Coleophoma cylindrospora]